MSSLEIDLACTIIKNQFGQLVSKVVRIVCENPRCTFRDILSLASRASILKTDSRTTSDTKHSSSKKDVLTVVKNSLAVLIQHSLLLYSRIDTDNSSDEDSLDENHLEKDLPFVYYANIPIILCRNRIPLYLVHIRRQYGNAGEAVVRTFLYRGKLTSFTLFKNALDPILQELDLTVQDAENCLKDMAKSGLLKWVTQISTSQPSIIDDSSLDEGIENGVLSCGSKRGREWESADKSDDDKSEEEPEYILVGRGENVQRVGAPLKSNDKDVWAVCYWHLNREFRNECCGFVAQNILKNDIATKILWTGLQMALEEEDCKEPSDNFETIDIGVEAIEKKLQEQEFAATQQQITEAVHLLASQTPQFAIGQPEQAPSLIRFVPGRLVAYARQKTLEEFLNTRYGQIGRRVFRALAVQGGMLEEDVADKCMLHVKVAREHLFRMQRDRIVTIQEVARSHDQQRASNWYYLWKVNLMAAYRSMIDIMYKTTLNLFSRQEMINSQDKSSEAMKKKIEAQDAMLVASILRLDQSIMVMNDFGPMTCEYFPARYTMIDGIIGIPKKRRGSQRIG